MPFTILTRLFAPSLLTAIALGAAHVQAAEPVKEVRLYALDCGHAEFKDMGMFSDTGESDGKPGALIMSCFVISHPKGALLWDTGMGDKLAENKDGIDNMGIHLSMPVTLASQLKTLGITPADVTYVGFSHFHFDHTGNANDFGASTWIINKNELNWAQSEPTPFGVDPATFSGYKTVKTKMIDGGATSI